MLVIGLRACLDNSAGRDMGGSGDADNGHHTKADLVNGRFNTTPARRQNGGFVIIEGALVEVVGFGAAKAAVARLNRYLW